VGHEEPKRGTSEYERQRKADYRERARLAEEDAGTPWQGLVGEEREQAIRTHYGYAASETGTQAQRQAAADRMVTKPKARLASELVEDEATLDPKTEGEPDWKAGHPAA